MRDHHLTRPRVSPELLASLSARLTDRDRLICELLWEHRVLTTKQIAEIAFDNVDLAEHRLVSLHRHRVVDRFRPRTETGSAPFHYVLDEMGASIVAADRGLDITKLGFRRERALAQAHRQRLAHTLGVNGFFAALTGVARRRPGCELLAWWSERQCADRWAPVVYPDAYGHWREDGSEVDFFLEYDRGTEVVDRVAAKLDGYRELAATTGIRTPLLVWLERPGREASVRRALTEATFPIATAAPVGGRTPADAVWLLLGRTEARLRLTQLAPGTARSRSVDTARGGCVMEGRST